MSYDRDDNIGINRPEYDEYCGDWELVDNAVESEGLDKYLPKLYPTDVSEENRARNADYKRRASWLGVTGFTLAGLIGTAYAKPPKITLPSGLDFMRGNVDGTGVSLAQGIQSSTREVLKTGRAGLFVTYPDTGGVGVSLADMASLKYAPTIHRVDADAIVNWGQTRIGAETVISLVVFTGEKRIGGNFSEKTIPIRRELRLVNIDGSYIFTDTTWRQNEKREWVILEGPFTPTNGAGKHWDRIPFAFIGAVDNTPSVDKSPMIDLARKNVAHYRNSADYEENVWFCGQAQPWASGLAIEDAIDLKEHGVYVGARRLLTLPDGGKFEYTTAPANVMVRQAMLDKVEEMASIGARLIQRGTVAKTAAQAIGEHSVQHSILSLAVENVATAYTVALKWAAEYHNQPADAIAVEPDKDFMTTPITPQDMQAFGGMITLGIIPESDQLRYLQSHDIVDPEKTIDEYKAELAADAENALANGSGGM